MAWVRGDIWKFWVYRYLLTRSIGVTRQIALRYGDRFGFVCVGGYPKSGTTWMSQLVAHCMDIPFPDHNALPLAFKCVVHHHWDYHPALDHSIQVVRDGRDVMVSMYMNLMRAEEARRERVARFGKLSLPERALMLRLGRDPKLARRMAHLFGKGFDPWDVERNLPIFIEADMERPLIEVAARPWPQYVRSWRDRGKRTVIVKYEEMLADGEGTLGRVLAGMLEREVDPMEVQDAVERYAFRRKTGRKQGEENRKSFARKGISGDWRNRFTKEAREVFHHHAGDLLIELGYEEDDAWVTEPDPEPMTVEPAETVER